MEYSDYKEIFYFGENYDTREYYLQRRLIEPFLQSLFPNFEIEDISVIRHNVSSSKHNDSGYIGRNANNNRVRGDLLLVEKWFFCNESKDMNYKATIEVKSHYDRKRNITGAYTFYENANVLKERITSLLAANKINCVILTDGLRWDIFLKVNDDNGKLTTNKKTFTLVEVANNMIWDFSKEKNFNDLKNYLLKVIY